MRARRALPLAVLLLAGCAADREVYVQVPLSRMELPEASARSLSIGVGGQSAVRAELTQDQTTTSPDPQHPKLEHESIGQLRFDWQVQRVQFSLRNWGQDLAGGQVKWFAVQPSPGSPLSLAISGGYGAASTKFDYDVSSSEESHTNIRQTLVDVGMVGGLRLDDRTLLFGGPFVSRNHYTGHYTSVRGSNPDVDERFEGDIDIAGANLGLAFTPQAWFTVAGEVSSARVKAGQDVDTPVTGTLMVRFSFGPRTRLPEAAEPPVEVVPVE